MSIPDSFFDELNARIDLVDFASEYVTLSKKSGKYWGCCPFHSEKTPSFSISPDKQLYYCFGCHKGGGLISFAMEAESLDFTDAVEFLANRAGLKVPGNYNKDAGNSKKRERLLELNKQAARYYNKNFYAPEAQAARDYLSKRKLSKRTITNFGIGYSLPKWDALINAMTNLGYTKEELLDAGLIIASDKGTFYDRFRGRIMFPIIDIKGNVIGFGGRVLDDSLPKYLNSPDTIIYNKSKNLFALNVVKKSKEPNIILTEGYMDTIALHQAGFDNAVASLGTSLTEEHARLLSKYTQEVILSYDGDNAGIAAAQRAIDILGKSGINVRVLKITGAKDPDEYIKAYGAVAFKQLLNGSENQIDYRILQIQNKYNLKQDDDKVKFSQESAELIAGLESPIEREIYSNKVASVIELDKKAMSDEVERQRRIMTSAQRKRSYRKISNPTSAVQPTDRRFHYKNPRSAFAEEGVLKILLFDITLFEQVQKLNLSEEQFSAEELSHIFSVIKSHWEEGRDCSVNSLSVDLSTDEISQLSRLMQQPLSRTNCEKALADYINTIHKEYEKRLFNSDSGQSDELLLAAARRKFTEEAK